MAETKRKKKNGTEQNNISICSNTKITRSENFVKYINYNNYNQSTIQVLLKRQDVLDEIEKCHNSKDPLISDFCDGKFVQNHPLCKDKKSLQLALYFDELEVANPLGSKRGKHKLGKP